MPRASQLMHLKLRRNTGAVHISSTQCLYNEGDTLLFHSWVIFHSWVKVEVLVCPGKSLQPKLGALLEEDVIYISTCIIQLSPVSSPVCSLCLLCHM